MSSSTLITIFDQLTLQLPPLRLRHLLRPLDRIDLARVRTGEYNVDLLQTSTLWLRAEEPDVGEQQNTVEDGEGDVGLVAQLGEGWWRDNYDQ